MPQTKTTHRHEKTDVLVIGAGAGGAIAAMQMAQAGLKTVCLEQGPWWPQRDFPHYRADWEFIRETRWNTAPNVRGLASDYPVDSSDETTLMWGGVGGATTIYTATWPRFRPSDFRKGTEHGLAPDWPIAYEDLADWYEIADRACGVAGWQGDPAMPPRGPYQTRPVPPGKMGRKAAQGLNRLGWHFWDMPVAILGEDYDGRPACNNCGNCQNGCPTGALNDMARTHWPRAIAAGCHLRTGARVECIETDDAGRATGAVYVDIETGTRHFQPADVVILAANGIGTARLLLLSESGRHPNGLANRSDQVGRNLMHHTLSIAGIWVDEPLDTHKGIVSAAYIVEEFAETDVSRGFVNGVTLHIVRMNGAGFQALGAHSGNLMPWGRHHHATFKQRFDRGIGCLIVGDDLPRPDNRVTLSDTIADSSGLPAPKVTYSLSENDERQLRFGIARSRELADALNATDYRINDFGLEAGHYSPGAWHLLGTARMGDNPETSVVNKWHQAWDCDNLFIVDGSVMCSGAAVNPTSTITALTYRASDHIKRNFANIAAGRASAHAAGA
ncbi:MULTISPECIES: GMC family oxidoreductase [unclassified Roseitalea]|uniref:GMC family oxidoreductase n=1 Tax=unclassified Roseitalea TaxID=2639107 RepID=UPI00273EB876|nr:MULTISPECIES: GMC family oxidoreductase [unclassified Roseitalea]